MKVTRTTSTHRTQKSAMRSTCKAASSAWSVPRGKDLRVVTKKAAGQVIRTYGETLRKLEKH